LILEKGQNKKATGSKDVSLTIGCHQAHFHGWVYFFDQTPKAYLLDPTVY